MRRLGRNLVLATAVLMTLSQVSYAVNRVTVQSKTFDINSAPDTVGILIENDVNITALVIPIEMRMVSGGAFTNPPFTNATFKWQEKPGGRIRNSPLSELADQSGNELWPGANVTKNRYPVVDTPACSGPTSNTYAASAAQCDGISPDGLLWATVSSGNIANGQEIFLTPGADVAPSYEIVFPVNGNPGTFEIDTCCMRPANHLSYVDPNTQIVTPAFVKGIITVVSSAVKELETSVIPQDYALEQNYPNPFNAGTVIRFQQPTDGNVKIDVYNILGRKVRTLVDEFRVAGTHQTDWNGRFDDGVEVATGVYFYRITAEGFTSTRKMVLLK